MNQASTGNARRRKIIAAGVAAVSAIGMWGSSTANADISVVDAPVTFTGATPTAGGSDSAFSQAENFSVSSGANVLVVNTGEFVQASGDLGVTMTWTPTGGAAQTFTLAKQQVSAASTMAVADAFYLNNPVSGAGTLTISGDTRTWGFGAMTLSGVNTTVAPIVGGADTTTGTTSAVILGTSASMGSFADVAQAFRIGAGTAYSPLTSTAGTPTQLYSVLDSTATPFIEIGGGSVSGVSGTPTITSTNTQGSNRSESAVEVFAPQPTGLIWTGGGGSAPNNGSWDTTASTSNWNLVGGGPQAYTDGLGVTFDDNGTNTNITIQGAGVNPGGMTFANSMKSYTLGGGAIGGTGTLTVNSVTGPAANVTLNGTNTFSGGTTIGSGIVTVGNDSALGTGPLTLTAAAATVNFVDGTPTISSLSGTAGKLVLGQTTSGFNTQLTINGSQTTTFAGTIQNTTAASSSGALIVAGTTALTLSGSNTYSGGTTINSGARILVANTAGSGLGTGNVSVLSGGILGGSGTILPATANAVTINAGGHLDPHLTATTTNTLTIGSSGTPATVNLNSGSILDYNVGSTSDAVQINGTLNVGSGSADTLNINKLSGFGVDGDFKLIGFTTLNGSVTWTVNATGVSSAQTLTVLAPSDSGGIAGQYTLAVTSPSEYIWTGLAGSAGTATWDKTSANWGGAASIYADGSPVLFDNSGTNPTITIPNGLTVSPGNPITFSNTTALTYNISSAGGATGTGGIGGAATSVVVSGGGKVTLGGANSYGGGTAISNGSTLQAGVSSTNSAFGSGGNITLVAGTVLDLNGQQITGANTPTLMWTSGNVTDNINASLTFQTPTGFSAPGTFGGNIVLLGATNHQPNGSGSYAFTGNISGVGGLNKYQGNIITLSGTNTFSGGLSVNGGAGTWQAGSPQAFSNTGPAINMGTYGASLDFNGQNMVAATPNITGADGTGAGQGYSYQGLLAIGAISNNNPLTAASYQGSITEQGDTTLGANFGGLTLSGNILGATTYNEFKVLGGTLTLSGQNTFKTMTVTTGTLAIPSDAASGPAPLGTVPASFSAANIVLTNSALSAVTGDSVLVNANRGITIGSATANGTTTFAGVGVLDAQSGATLTYGGTITSNGTAVGNGLTKTGPGIVDLTNATLSYTGQTTVKAGTLNLGSQTLTGGLVTYSGATVNTNGANLTIPSTSKFLTGATATTGSMFASTSGFTVSGSDLGNDTASRTINLAGGTLSLNNAAQQTTSGFGTTGVGWKNNGSATIAGNVLTTVNQGGQNTGSSWFTTKVPINLPWTATYTMTNPGTNGLISGDDAGFVIQNNSTSAIAGSNSDAFSNNNGTPANTPTPSAAVLAHFGTNGNNNINDGITYNTNANANGTPTTLTANPVHFDSTAPVNFTVSYDGSGSLNVTAVQGSGTYYSVIPVGNLATLLGGNSAFIGFVGATGGNVMTNTISNFTFNTIAPTGGVNAPLTAINVTGSATIDGSTDGTPATAGPVILGGLNVANGVTLTGQNATALTFGLAALDTGSSLIVSNIPTTVAGLADKTPGTSTGQTVNIGSANLTITGTGTQTFAGNISNGAGSGGGLIINSTTGTQTLSGSNSYSGPTNITSGTLNLTATASLPGTLSVTVSSNGALSGTGSIGAISSAGVSVASGGKLSPGAVSTVPAAMTITGSLSLASGSTLNISVASASNYSRVNFGPIGLSGYGVAGSTLVVNDTGASLAVGETLWILNGASSSALIGAGGNFSNGTTVTGTSGDQYTILYDAAGDPNASGNNDIGLQVTSVPEPASLGLLGLGALGLLSRRRRK